jgi:hypothetical protein
MTEQQGDTRRPTGDAAWKAHLDAVQRRNAEARKKAADVRSAADVAAVARAYRLKGD